MIAGRSVVAFRRKDATEVPAAKCFGFVQTYDKKPRRRLWELMKSQGMQENQQVVFMSDGGEDGAKARRTWKKLHLAVEADTGMIMASTLTGNDVGDPSQVAPLLDQIEATIASVTADGAHDGMPIYEVVAGHGEDIRVIIPPHVTAILSAEAEHNPSQRDQHILSIADRGRLGWQQETDYGQRALVETAIGRYKAIIGPRLRARSFSGQKAEAEVGVSVLNRMLNAGRPDSVRRPNIAA